MLTAFGTQRVSVLLFETENAIPIYCSPNCNMLSMGVSCDSNGVCYTFVTESRYATEPVFTLNYPGALVAIFGAAVFGLFHEEVRSALGPARAESEQPGLIRRPVRST